MFSLKKNKMSARGPTTQAKNWHSQYLEVSMCFSCIIPITIPHNEDHSPKFRINYSLPFFIVLLPMKISINNIYNLVLYFLNLNYIRLCIFFSATCFSCLTLCFRGSTILMYLSFTHFYYGTELNSRTKQLMILTLSLIKQTYWLYWYGLFANRFVTLRVSGKPMLAFMTNQMVK